ncbi:serine/threonine-protein phosphatase 7 long form-like protein [Gossypium australe]|uniref:Serine/threonine-protein phosphatase 7 long form-like protein n=1 Tax=Gossypium australe TaxID=47621 RepID=A0A5B6WN05_9ROSI|nr:serine/threonine-protein phosphatase 7 long form-like protein [Gossypium australe]
MPNKSRNLVHIRWLVHLIGFKESGRLSWGPTVLAMLRQNRIICQSMVVYSYCSHGLVAATISTSPSEWDIRYILRDISIPSILRPYADVKAKLDADACTVTNGDTDTSIDARVKPSVKNTHRTIFFIEVDQWGNHLLVEWRTHNGRL